MQIFQTLQFTYDELEDLLRITKFCIELWPPEPFLEELFQSESLYMPKPKPKTKEEPNMDTDN